jgi:hypothetical protein
VPGPAALRASVELRLEDLDWRNATVRVHLLDDEHRGLLVEMGCA